MATPWERAQISSPVYEHTKRSRGLVQRLRWGQRLQDAAAEEQLLEEARRRPRFRPASAPSARSGLSTRSNQSESSTSEAPVSAAAIALASVPSTLKEQLAKDAELKELAKLRWQAIAAAGPLFVQHSKGLSQGDQGNIVNEVAHAAFAKGRLDDRIADSTEPHRSPDANRASNQQQEHGQAGRGKKGARRSARVHSGGSNGDAGAGGAVTSLAHALNDVVTVPSVYSHGDAGSVGGAFLESLVFNNSTVQGKEANGKAKAQQALAGAGAGTGAGGGGGGNSSSASSANHSPHAHQPRHHSRHSSGSSSSPKRPRYEAGCPVYFGSVLSLRSTHHGGCLAADGGRHCDASAASPFSALGTAPLPPPLLLDPEAVAAHEAAVAAVAAAASADRIGVAIGDGGRKSSTPALFTVWSGDGNVGEAEGENATDGMGGMLRYGDAVFLQCGAHKASTPNKVPPPAAAAGGGGGYSQQKSGKDRAPQPRLPHAKLLGCSAMAADAPDLVERAVQTYHDNRSSHAFAYADARSADHARLALKGVSPRVIHGLGAGSGGGAETEGLTRQAYARLAAKRAEETAKQRRKAVADSRSTQPPQPSNNHSAHPPPGSRLVAVTAATDGDSSTSGGSGGALGTTKREAHWRSAARWVVKPGPAALEQGAQLGDEVKHGDAVVLEQSWGAITSRRPHAVALESRAASKHNHLQPLPAVQSPAVAASAVAVKSPTRPAAAAAAEEKANDPNNERVASDQSALTNEPASPDVPAADSEAAPVRVEAAPVGAQAGAVENEAAIGTGSGTGATAAAVAAATRPDEDAPDTTACVWQVELVYLPQAAPMERARQAQLAEAAQEQAEGAHRQQGCVAASNALAGAFREEATRLVEVQLKGPEQRLLQLDYHLRSRYMDVARTHFDFEENVPLRSPQSLAKVYGPTSSFAVKAAAKAKKSAELAARQSDALTQFRRRLPLKTRTQLIGVAAVLSSSSGLVENAQNLGASHRSQAAADAADAAERLAAEIWFKQAPDAWRHLMHVMDAVAVLLRCARRYLARKRDRYPFRGHKWHVGMAGEDEDLQGKWFRALTQGGKAGALKAAIEETEQLRQAKVDAVAREAAQRAKAKAKLQSVVRASMMAVALSSGGKQGRKAPSISGSAAAKLFINQNTTTSSSSSSDAAKQSKTLKSIMKKEAKLELEAEATATDGVRSKMEVLGENQPERDEHNLKTSLLRLEIPSSPTDDHHHESRLHDGDNAVVPHPEVYGDNGNAIDGLSQQPPSRLSSSLSSSERVAGANATIPGLGSRPSLPSQNNAPFVGGVGGELQLSQQGSSSLAGSYKRFAAAAEAKDSLTETQAIALLAQDFPDHFQGFKLLRSRQRSSPKQTTPSAQAPSGPPSSSSSSWSQRVHSIERGTQNQHLQPSKASAPSFIENSSFAADSAATPLLLQPSSDVAAAVAAAANEPESEHVSSALAPKQAEYRVFGQSALDSRARAPPPQITRPLSASVAVRSYRNCSNGYQQGQEQQPRLGNQSKGVGGGGGSGNQPKGASSSKDVDKTEPTSLPQDSNRPILGAASAAAPPIVAADTDATPVGQLGDAHATGQAALAQSAATRHGLQSPDVLAVSNTSLRHPPKGELALHVVPRLQPTARGSSRTTPKNSRSEGGKCSKTTKRPTSAPASRSQTNETPTALQGHGVHRIPVQALKSSPLDYLEPGSNPFMSPAASVSTGPSFSGLLATPTPPPVQQQQQRPQQLLKGQAKYNGNTHERPRSATAAPRTPLSGAKPEAGGGSAAAAARRSTRPLSAQSARGDKKQSFTVVNPSPSPSQNFATIGRSALPNGVHTATGAVSAAFPGPSAAMRVAPFTPLESLGKQTPTYDPALSGTGYTNRARPRSSLGPRGDAAFEATNRWQGAPSPTNANGKAEGMHAGGHAMAEGGVIAAAAAGGVGNGGGTRAAPGGKVLRESTKAVVIDGGCLTPASNNRRW